MNEELVRLDETFKKRKQTIEESSSSFMADLQKIVDEKPEFGEENHNRILLEHQELLLKNYEDYKKREEAIRRQLGWFFCFKYKFLLTFYIKNYMKMRNTI